MAGEKKGRCGLLLLSLAALVMLAVALVAVPWWMQWSTYREAAATTAERIARYRSLIDSRDAFKAQLRQLEEQPRERGYFIEADNPELAAADLQQRIKEMVSKAGGTLVSTQSIFGDEKGPPRKVEIKVRMKGDVEALAKVLYAIERNTPVLMVEDLAVRSRRTVKGRRNNRVEGYSLDANFRVIGYMMGASP